MTRIAIVEDNQGETAKLNGYIERYSAEKQQPIAVSRFMDGEDIVSDYRPEYDIIFLDIQMARLDGMTTAEHIRALDQDVVLVFITNMAQYAIKGYAVNALDFLLKPVSYFAFSQLLSRCLARLKARTQNYLLLPAENGIKRINVNDVHYIESLRHRITVHTAQGEYQLATTMRELETRLTPLHFFRCNSGCLVNLSCVTGMEDGNILAAGEVLAVSRARKKPFLDALNNYIGGIRA